MEGRQHGPQLRRPGREGFGERNGVRLVLGRGIQDRRGEALEHRERPGRLELVCFRPEDPLAALLGAQGGLVEDPRLPISGSGFESDERPCPRPAPAIAASILAISSARPTRPGSVSVVRWSPSPITSGGFGSPVEAALDLEEILQHPRGSCVAITRILLEQPPDDVVERARRRDARCADAR